LGGAYRGFYFPAFVRLAPEDNEAAPDWLFEEREKQGIFQLIVDLSAFSTSAGGADGDLSEDALNCVDGYLQKAQDTGKSVIFRASYNMDGDTDEDGEFSENEPEMAVVLRHVEQLSEVLSDCPNLMVVQSGMFGPWGEQHGTTAAQTPSNYYELVEAWLKGIAQKDVTVAVRRPLYFTYWYNMKYDTDFTAETMDKIPAATPATDAYRVGVYNDGLLHDASDYGTFTSEAEKEWMQRQSAHTYYGGETVLAAEPWTGAEIIERFTRFHLSYLNYEYDQDEHQRWKDAAYTGGRAAYKGKTVYEYVEAHMGYRFTLTELNAPKSIAAGGTLTVNAKVQNVGFAPFIKGEAAVELTLTGADGAVIAKDNIKVDLNAGTAAWNVPIPKGAPAGEYTLYAAFADGIRFANQDMWQADQNADRLAVFSIA
jgi:hypothetical protein